ncbi:MAG: tetratricopeptide repeat protein [Calditrichaeota bacterium]|nr:MAG: tetratricopeptide repeat protein [Calditrichota bacterium]
MDEIIIVDTGSKDNTVKIAESYGAKVYHQQWEGDFSKHRNYSIEQAKSDWIFIIDADERMYAEDLPMLKSVLNDKANNLISINVFNVYGTNEEVTTFLPSVRFFRKEKKLRYEGIVHNRLNYKADEEIVRANIKLKHLGYGLDPDKMEAKFQRTKLLLEQQLKDEPENAFALFNYAQILKAEGDNYPVKNIPEIIKAARKAVELTDPNNPEERFIHLMTLDQIAWANFYAGRFDDAITYAQKALHIKKNYLDPLMLLGCVESKRNNWDKAEQYFKNYLKTQAAYEPTNEADSLILAHIDSRANVYYNLGLMCEMKNDIEKALENYLKAIELNNGLLEANDHIARIYLGKNELTQAKKYFQQQLEYSYETKTSFLGLAEISKQEKNRGQTEEYLTQAVKLVPKDPYVNYKYGYFLLEENTPETAVRYLEKSYAVNQENPKVVKVLADTYFMLGRYEDALDKYNKLLKLEKPNAAILNDIGNCYFNLKNYVQAANSYKESLSQVEPLEFTKKNLAIAELKQSNDSEALAALQSYLTKNNTDIEALILCGDIYKKTEEYQAALEKYEYILSLDRSNIHAMYQLSECYLIMGHKDSAIMGYKTLLSLNPQFKPAIARLEEISTVETYNS